MSASLTEEQRRALSSAFSFYRNLTNDVRPRYDARVAEFMATKRFVSDGRPVDDRTRLFISALACRMTLCVPYDCFGRLSLISVVDKLENRSGVQLGGRTTTGGLTASVAFLRTALARTFSHDEEGYNVVYHELAHVLDAGDQVVDGIPPLLVHPERRDAWRETLSRELERLRAARDLGMPTAIRSYGATNEIELFAEATTAFFERPTKVKNAHPDLYGLLVEYYGQDPEWRGVDLLAR